MPVSKEILDEIALKQEEYDEIVRRLGREPNSVELGMFGALWSEHCGYKHSKQLLRTFPSESPYLLTAPGQENAGAIDIGDGLSAVIKVESHNHPSAIEPYQGAATGVGGIVRDILAMGARPIALMNSLRFGPLSEQQNRHLFNGVVSGISGYGNCIGVPDIGGEIAFAPSYSGNPLVNALCLGIVRSNEMVRAIASTPGNILLLAGAETGRDGIHGASGLASRTFEEDIELRPTVQVGNPFMEKILIEACLEVVKANLLEGLQDLGAAGLTSSIVEATTKGGTGFKLDVALVPRRESGMSPYEIMLSESQERMLLIVSPENVTTVTNIMEKWDIPCTAIGEVTGDGIARIFEGSNPVGAVPGGMLTHPPIYEVFGDKPNSIAELQNYDLKSLPTPADAPYDILLKLLASPNITSKEFVYRQYDHQVQTNTVLPPGTADAAVVRIKGSDKGLALSSDCNGRIGYLDPFVGGALAVAEACRNVSCTGATPVAITDCLNFGNPEKPDVAYQMVESVRGMVEACNSLNVPVVSGNVSLYNETKGTVIYPTPVVCALGLIDDVNKAVSSGFRNEGDSVFLLGSDVVSADVNYLAGSEYLEIVHGLVAGQPSIDLGLEVKLQSCCRSLVENQVVNSAHDCSEGGLAVALAESSIIGNLGFSGSIGNRDHWAPSLFGEQPSRVVVSVSKDKTHQFKDICYVSNTPFVWLGTVTSGEFSISGIIDGSLSEISSAWKTGLSIALGE
ncbi:MAG: phosphoribosylformylglycinamidine synthase [Chloroflexi bacterium]|nr:MAG: phosphoribosylformylglycinamidine synthase [Chloroflexota bacterium]